MTLQCRKVVKTLVFCQALEVCQTLFNYTCCLIDFCMILYVSHSEFMKQDIHYTNQQEDSDIVCLILAVDADFLSKSLKHFLVISLQIILFLL